MNNAFEQFVNENNTAVCKMTSSSFAALEIRNNSGQFELADVLVANDIAAKWEEAEDGSIHFDEFIKAVKRDGLLVHVFEQSLKGADDWTTQCTYN